MEYKFRPRKYFSRANVTMLHAFISLFLRKCIVKETTIKYEKNIEIVKLLEILKHGL